MKIAEYNQMMAYLMRPKFNGGGSVGAFVKPKKKPEKEVKKRKLENFEKAKPALENPEEVKKMLNLADGGRIPFGIPALDTLTGGGIPKKRMTLIYGPTNVGKSYLSSQIVAQVQKQGGRAAWIDTELSWDADWMSKCGIDASKVVVGQPSSGEQAMDSI